MEAVECGAAALAIILAYFGRWVPLEELRHECGVSRDGSKANNVLKAARRYGLEAKGYKYDSVEKLFDLEFPAILFWNLNHFVVLDGFRGTTVYINDPAQGPRTVTWDEFDGSYSGIVLTFKPTDEFQKKGSKPSILPALWSRLGGSKTALLFVILCGLLLVIPGLAVPAFTRTFIDDILIGEQAMRVTPLLLFMAGAVIVQAVLTWLQEHYLLKLETKLAVTNSASFFSHILRLPAAYFGQRFGGEIGSRLQINDNVAKVISGKLATTAVDSVMTVFYAALMFTYDVWLTLTVIGIALLNVAAVRLVSRWRVDASRRLLLDKGKLLGTAMGGLQMIETLKATGSETEFFGRWAGYHSKTINSEQFLGVLAQLVNMVPPIVETCSRAAVLVLGGLAVMDGRLTMGMLVAYQTLFQGFTRPLNNFVQFGGLIQQLQADMNRLDDVLRYPIDEDYSPERQERKLADTVVKLSGKIELRNISFGYNPLEPPLIDNLSLTIEPGERVAFVGSSGSGKSTVAKLISGLNKPVSGDILFDDIPRSEIPRRLLVDSIAVVDQELFLFGDTVSNNVTMWDPNLDGARVARACQDAQISDVIEARAGAYRSDMREGGGNFSGGQCQRIEIARALVGEPSILILDEATSALDPTTEEEISEAIRRRACTTIMIAHRLSTVRDCDKIVVLERGAILEFGNHEELMIKDGAYKRLVST